MDIGDLNIDCQTCGEELGFDIHEDTISVERCDCQDEEIEQSGYDSGHTEGEEVGYENGVEAGEEDGYSNGHSDGYSEGRDDGEEAGYESGYEDGANSTQNQQVFNLVSVDEYNRRELRVGTTVRVSNPPPVSWQSRYEEYQANAVAEVRGAYSAREAARGAERSISAEADSDFLRALTEAAREMNEVETSTEVPRWFNHR